MADSEEKWHHQQVAKLEIKTVENVPPPPHIQRGRPPGEVPQTLLRMSVGSCIDINRTDRTVRGAIWQLKRDLDFQGRYAVRQQPDGSTRVWRLQ